jgi:hypothetical protein
MDEEFLHDHDHDHDHPHDHPHEPDHHIHPVNSFIDKISLEFLLNKTHYHKYLAKTDPQLYAEQQDFLESCSHYRRPILDMTAGLLENPKSTQYSREVCDAFDKYAQTLIRYLEVKERSDNAQKVFQLHDDDDDETLFPESMNHVVSSNPTAPKHSKTGTKTSTKTGTLDAFVLRK